MVDAKATKAGSPCEFKPWLVYLFCFVIALVFMFFFSVNSPIYTFNSHCDFQWYMTVGRGLMAGKVPYRDLFEHKGPIVYFVFGVASLFPNPSVAIWFIEILCLSLFLYFGYRIARKFLSPWLSLLSVPLVMSFLSTVSSGLGATRVEEFCLPIFAYGFLCFLDFFLDKRPMTWQRSFAIGIGLGILFWVKYSMLLFFLFPMLAWFVVSLFQRRFLALLRSGLVMLGGVLVVTLPVIIYFAAVGGLDSLWEVYFQINIGNYTGDMVGLSESELYLRKWTNSLAIFALSPFFLIYFIFGLICFAIKYWKQKIGWILLLVVIPTWLSIGFFCGYFYYYTPLYVYALLGVIYAVKVVVHMLTAVDLVICRLWVRRLMLFIAVLASFFFLALPFVSYIVEINQPRENYAPFVVADIIAEYNQTAAQPATLFCYRMADCGFYNAAGLIPNVRYFAENSFTQDALPEEFAAFDETIRNQVCDFVITYEHVYLENEAFLSQYYDFYFETKEVSTLPYVLFIGNYIESKIVILFRK